MKPFDKILFANDFTEYSEHAFDWALMLAKEFDARLIIIHVINLPVDLSGFYAPAISFDRLDQEIETGAEKKMQQSCRTRIRDFADYETAIERGIPYERILAKAEEEKVSLIVLGTQGRKGIDHLLFGSTAEQVTRKAGCPVLTVRSPE